MRFRWACLLMSVLFGSIAACGGGGSDDGGVVSGFRVSPVPAGFELGWEDGGAVQIEVSSQAPRGRGWGDASGWAEVPVSHGADGRVVFDDVSSGHRYRFRIRSGGGGWSEPVERLYVQTSLPVVRIDIDDGEPILDDKRRYRDGRFALDPGGGEDGSVDRQARVRGRGNSTWALVEEKKSYQVAFDEPVSLLGMPAADKWVLLANYFDQSQLREFVSRQIAGIADVGWVPAMDWVELYLNDEYAGVYVLSEKIDTGPDKVDVDVPGPQVTGGPELTGGYLLQIEREDKDHKRVWRTPRDVQIAVQRPKKDDSNDEQFAYISGYVDRFEDVLFSDDFTDPDHGYRAYLDVPTYIDYWIVQELTFKTDAYQDSAYFTKRRGDPKLYFGPVWDFDVALGNRYGGKGPVEMMWLTTTPRPDSSSGAWELRDRPWVVRIFEDPWFREQVTRRWAELAPRFAQIPDRIPEVAAHLQTARTNDLLRWREATDLVPDANRYGDEVDGNSPEYVADWLDRRIAWMTENIDDAYAGSAVDRPGG